MKLAIVPALALATAGGVALMASPASATPEVGQRAGQPAPFAMTPDSKWYDHKDDHKDDNNGDVCNIYQFFPGFNIASGQVLNDAIDASVTVVLQLLTVLGSADSSTENPIINDGCL
jgi:hypothetical protein